VLLKKGRQLSGGLFLTYKMITYLKEIFYLLGDKLKKLPWLVGLFLASSMLDLAGLGIIGPYVSLIMNRGYLEEGHFVSFLSRIGISFTPEKLIVIIGLGLVGIFLLKAAAGIFINWQIIKFTAQCKLDLRTYLMQAYQQQPYLDYVQRNSSEYIQSIHSLVGQFANGALQSLLKLLSEGIVSFFVLVFLALTNAPVLMLLLALLGVGFLSYDRIFRHRIRLYGKRLNESIQKMVQGIHEGIYGFKEIRILGKTAYFNNIVKENAKEGAENAMKASLVSNSPRYLFEFVLIAFIVSFVVISLIFGSDITHMAATLGIFAVASLRLVPSANSLMSVITQLRFSRYATSRLYNDLRKLRRQKFNKISVGHGTIKDKSFESLTLANISFRYPKAKEEALVNINLSIKAGESIGIIGPSGSGKTTLIDIILGLFEPDKGEIFYNGRPIKEVLVEWRSQVAYLPQEIFLIDNTLRRNVALGENDEDIDDSRVYDSLRQARLIELVEGLPQGLDTFIGERGVRLSGGQRQRVALARAFYHRRDVLVLDEATSALDYETERQIVEEIKYLKRKKTLVVIAHRFATVEHCQRIYKLEKGAIVKSGSYSDVIANKSVI